MHDISTYHDTYHAEHLFEKRAIFRIDIALSRLSRYLDIQARRTQLMYAAVCTIFSIFYI